MTWRTADGLYRTVRSAANRRRMLMAKPVHYEIRVQGQLDPHWSDWFEGFGLEHRQDGSTILLGPVLDGAALFGLLERVRDLGLKLISVNPRPSP